MTTSNLKPLAFSLILLTLAAGSLAERVYAQGPILNCPDTSLGEKPEDCPWAGAARLLEGPTATLKDVLPSLYQAVAADGKRSFIQSAWGESINFDELVKAEIVPAKTLEELEQAFGFKGPIKHTGKGYRVAHAGMEHTYGYLLSNLKTSFGYKRARWVSGEIERGFGLPTGTISPEPKQSSLLSNATYLLGKIALRKDAKSASEFALHLRGAPAAIRNLDVSKLQIVRLQEESSDGILLRTDLVTFPTPQTNTRLLIYSVLIPALSDQPKLVTAFPVAEGFVTMVLDPTKLGDSMPIITRYNAYVAAITDAPAPVTGKRALVKE